MGSDNRFTDALAELCGETLTGLTRYDDGRVRMYFDDSYIEVRVSQHGAPRIAPSPRHVIHQHPSLGVCVASHAVAVILGMAIAAMLF